MKKSMSLSERCRKEWREVKSNEDPKHRLLALAVIIGNVLTPDSIIICFFFHYHICGEFDELGGVCSLEIEQWVFWNHETMKAFKFQPRVCIFGEFLWEFNKRTSCESETIPPDRRRLTLTLAAPMTVQQPRDRWPAMSWHYWHDMHKALNNRVEIFPVIPSDAERNKNVYSLHAVVIGRYMSKRKHYRAQLTSQQRRKNVCFHSAWISTILFALLSRFIMCFLLIFALPPRQYFTIEELHQQPDEIDNDSAVKRVGFHDVISIIFMDISGK